MMELCFRGISELHRDHGHVVDSDKVARETLIVAELCRRLHTDDYAELAGYDRYDEMNELQRRKWAQHTAYLANQDAEYLGKMFRKVRRWWQ